MQSMLWSLTLGNFAIDTGPADDMHGPRTMDREAGLVHRALPAFMLQRPSVGRSIPEDA